MSTHTVRLEGPHIHIPMVPSVVISTLIARNTFLCIGEGVKDWWVIAPLWLMYVHVRRERYKKLNVIHIKI